MATVRMSTALVNDMRSRFDSAFRKRIDAVWEDARAEMHTDSYRHAAQSAMANQYGLTDAQYASLPDRWVITAHTLYITAIGDVCVPMELRIIRYPEPIFVPVECHGRGYNLPMELPMSDGLQPFADIVKKYSDIVDNMRTTHEEAPKQLRTLLESVPSLNKLLEAHPALEPYVPSHYIARINEVVERKTRKAVPDLDVSSLNLSVVQNRLSNAHG